MPLLKAVSGVNEAKSLTESQIIKFSRHLKIPSSDNFELDTSYVDFLYSLDSTRFAEQIKNHYQPLQALYFDKSGQLAKFYINCYAGGFPVLKWNCGGNLKSFPPSDQAPVDCLLTLSTQIKFLKNIDNATIDNLQNFDYVIFIYWNHFMQRHSRHLVHSIQKNCALATSYSIKIIFVNNDNVFALFDKN